MPFIPKASILEQVEEENWRWNNFSFSWKAALKVEMVVVN